MGSNCRGGCWDSTSPGRPATRRVLRPSSRRSAAPPGYRPRGRSDPRRAPDAAAVMSTGLEAMLGAITRAARERAVSPDPLPIPAQCDPAYDRYAADLRRSALAASTRSYHARCVRRFLRWLPANTADITAVLTQPPAWHTAATQFIAELASCNGPLSTDVQTHRFALADCAQRLGLADTYATVPGRFGWLDDAYAAAAATTSQATATREA